MLRYGILIALLVTGCGRDVCFLGMGDCSAPHLRTSGVKELTIESSAPTVQPGGQVTFTAKGGRPPYRFSIQQGDGTITDEGIYIASTVKGVTVIRVTDDYGRTQDIAIIVVD